MMSIFAGLSASASTLSAEEAEQSPSSFQAGVLELAGSTSFSVDYQKEGNRETTHVRLTPSIGYFILNGLEAQVRVSYIFDNVHESSATEDRSERLLFTLGPVYHFQNLSDLLVPYVGVNLGTYYQKFRTDVSSRADLQLAFGLEAGCRWMFTENLGLKLGFFYVHGFESDQIDDTDFLGLEMGISLFIPTWPTY
jgi:hypothetical protein